MYKKLNLVFYLFRNKNADISVKLVLFKRFAPRYYSVSSLSLSILKKAIKFKNFYELSLFTSHFAFSYSGKNKACRVEKSHFLLLNLKDIYLND